MSHTSSVDTPVVVVGSSTTAMSVIRLVVQADYPVYAACPRDAWPSQSRYFRELPANEGHIWRGELGDSGYRQMERLPFDRCVLMPSADDTAKWMSRLPKHLLTRFSVSSSSLETLRALQNKSEFSRLTSRLDVPAPRSFDIQDESDIINIPFEKLTALFLKPTDSQAFSHHYGKKAVWIDSRDQAIAEWSQICADGLSSIAQEYVPGGADDHYFIDGFRDRHGIVRAATARRRIRIYPIDFGNSSYCQSIPFSEVENAWVGLEKILQEVEYRGIFSAEFKKDEHDGQFKILEINTRPWIYIEFAGVCGMNLCDLYIRDALGMDVPTIEHYSVGMGCVDLFNDLCSVIKMPASARPRISELLVTWMRSFKLLFAWRDPKPAMIFMFRRVSVKLKKLISK